MEFRAWVPALSLTALLLAACATEPAASAAPPTAPAPAATAVGQEESVCVREYATGSNIAVTRCRTRAQIDAEKFAATENLRRAQTGGPNAKPGGSN